MLLATFILTILNTIFLLWFLLIRGNLSFHKTENTHFKITTSYDIFWKNRGIFHIPIRNAVALDIKEDVERLMKPNNPNVRYILNAKCSWLKSNVAIDKFVRDYSIVNEDMVLDISNKYRNKLLEKESE